VRATGVGLAGLARDRATLAAGFRFERLAFMIVSMTSPRRRAEMFVGAEHEVASTEVVYDGPDARRVVK
jgi:hypothetical protein